MDQEKADNKEKEEKVEDPNSPVYSKDLEFETEEGQMQEETGVKEPTDGQMVDEVEEVAIANQPKKKKWPVVEEILELFWAGFITKSKKTQVGVDAYLQSGKPDFLEQGTFNLNISHKTNFEEVLSKTPLAVIIFIPSNQTMKNRFMEYYNYLSQKKISGIVNHLKDRLMYIVPSCPDMLKVAPDSSPNQLIGIITTFEKKDASKGPKTPENEQKDEEDSEMEVLEDDGETKKKVIPEFDPKFGDKSSGTESDTDSRTDMTDDNSSRGSTSDSRL